ncbi:hypothetical protein QWY82_17830 [Simiduia curdlanivorans]|uniref:Uncharacterized protein n=1 Tax=Simiduia curdlanivorans TaxID=1492769 RepID=A0ABV8V7L3_9GAMM|nr:hypothetical protein [Simiduia curdlanivorans]MDN3640662.1 hypothetical protein [Simiduia curdlanivorans]
MTKARKKESLIEGMAFSAGLGLKFFFLIFIAVIPLNVVMDLVAGKSVAVYFTVEFVGFMFQSLLLWGILLFSVAIFVAGGLLNKYRNRGDQ